MQQNQPKLRSAKIKDSMAREITIQDLCGMRRLTLLRLTGNDPMNYLYFDLIKILLHVTAINGVSLKMPYTLADIADIFNFFLSNFKELEQGIALLGDESVLSCN